MSTEEQLGRILDAFVDESANIGFEVSNEQRQWLKDVARRALHEGDSFTDAVDQGREAFWGLQAEVGNDARFEAALDMGVAR